MRFLNGVIVKIAQVSYVAHEFYLDGAQIFSEEKKMGQFKFDCIAE